MHCLLLAMLMITTWTGRPHRLDAFKWNNRVLLLFAPESTDRQLTAQLAAFHPRETDLADRDLLVFTVTKYTEADIELRSHFKVAPESYTLILIGKDGTEKLRKHAMVPTDDIFRLIDSMPMRRNGGH